MLTPKQQRFVEEYLVDLNATEAYKRAGYKGKGRTAENNASRLLGNAGVAAAIQEAIAARAQTSKITAQRVLDELAAVAFSDLGEIVEITPLGIQFRGELGEAARRAVASIKVRQELGSDHKPPAQVVEFRLWPKTDALRLLAQHLGMLKEVGSKDNPLHARIRTAPEDLSDEDLLHIAASRAPKPCRTKRRRRG